MKIHFKIFALPVLILFLFTGCASRSPQPTGTMAHRAVTEVTVTYQNGAISAQRHYTNAEKMRRILNYLRIIDPYGVPNEDPETAEGSDFYIVLSYSDGSHKTYHQKSDRFLLEEGGQWQRIDPTKAEELSLILGEMESDEA